MVKAPQSEERLAGGGKGNNSVLGKSSAGSKGTLLLLKGTGCAGMGVPDFNFLGELARLNGISAEYFYFCCHHFKIRSES